MFELQGLPGEEIEVRTFGNGQYYTTVATSLLPTSTANGSTEGPSWAA